MVIKTTTLAEVATILATINRPITISEEVLLPPPTVPVEVAVVAQVVGEVVEEAQEVVN